MGWRLDYFLMTNNFSPYLVDSEIHGQFLGSDHCPVQIKLDLTGETYKKRKDNHKDKTTADSSPTNDYFDNN